MDSQFVVPPLGGLAWLNHKYSILVTLAYSKVIFDKEYTINLGAASL